MKEESTKKPGIQLAEYEELQAIDGFLQKFRSHDLVYSDKRPCWASFPKGDTVGPEFLLTESIRNHETLLVFYEFQKQVWEASPAEIVEYLANREPWEDFDLYIFPSTMEWCCVFTHELMDGIQSFVISTQ